MPTRTLIETAVCLMLGLAVTVSAQTPPLQRPLGPGSPAVELREDTTLSTSTRPSARGPVIHRAAATSPRHMSQGRQNPVRVEVPQGLGAGWIILLGAALGVYVLYRACQDCMGIHPVVIAGAVLLGILVVSIAVP
jgi:hypothetical protein